MRPITIFLTAVGCPGAHDLIRCLKYNGEREIKIVGTDILDEVGGRFFVDAYYKISPSKDEEKYIKDILNILKKEKIDIFFPQSSSDVIPVSKNLNLLKKNCGQILLCDYETIETCDNKNKMVSFFSGSGIPLPKTIRCENIDQFRNAVYELGYPEHDVCFKPAQSKGARGFRILSSREDKYNTMLFDKTENTKFTLEECLEVFKQKVSIPELLVTEFIDAEEVTFDAFCENGEVRLGFLKTRERVRSGLAMYFKIVDEPQLVDHSHKIIKQLDFNYFINIQFRGGKLMEINPRISTMLHQPDFNMPYLSLKYYLGEIPKEELSKYSISPNRRTVRYYTQVNYDFRDGCCDNVMRELTWNGEYS